MSINKVKKEVKKMFPKNAVGLTKINGESAIVVNLTEKPDFDLPETISGIKIKYKIVGKVVAQ